MKRKVQLSETKRSGRLSTSCKIMSLKPTEKSRLKNRNLGIILIKRIIETVRVEFYERVQKRVRVDEK